MLRLTSGKTVHHFENNKKKKLGKFNWKTRGKIQALIIEWQMNKEKMMRGKEEEGKTS